MKQIFAPKPTLKLVSRPKSNQKGKDMEDTKKIREISQDRMQSLSEESKHEIDDSTLNQLNYMRVGDSLDLNKAINVFDYATAKAITKEPRRQSFDEKKQFELLKSEFPNIIKPNKTYLLKGNVITDKKVLRGNPPDLDALCKFNDWTIAWTEKGGQKEDGGAQNHQFDNVLNVIGESPTIQCKNKNILAVFVSGDFWVKLRSKYKYYKVSNKRLFSLVDVLQKKAKGRRCIIFSDNSMPSAELLEKYIEQLHV